METCIPKGTLPKKKKLPWLTKNLIRAMRKRNWLYRRARNSGQATWYKAARNKALAMLRNEKQSYFDKHVNNVSNRQFWKTIKFLKKEAVSISTRVDEEHNKAIEDRDKVNMLSSFDLIHRWSLQMSCLSTIQKPLVYTMVLTGLMSYCAQKKFSDCSSQLTHPRQMSRTKFLGKRQLLYTSIAYPIVKLFNKSILSCSFPTCWKDSFIVPIPKLNNRNSPNNYRPVSLLFILSKLFEKHIYGVLFHYLEETQPISNYQWGFQAELANQLQRQPHTTGYSCLKMGLPYF